MQEFGNSFCLTLITSDPALAMLADRAGVDRIGVDLEVLGKAQRQTGHDTRLSNHTLDDLRRVAGVLTRARAFARVNPVNSRTRDEVETALQAGADVMMLPFFASAVEVETFVRHVAGRASVVILVETPPAVLRIRECASVDGVAEVMIGLNDLRIAFGVESHFEVLASPLMDMLSNEVHRAGRAFSVGGVARPGDRSLPVPADLVLAQYPRLGATGAWLSRAFFNGLPADAVLADELNCLRSSLDAWASQTPDTLEKARSELARTIQGGAVARKPG